MSVEPGLFEIMYSVRTMRRFKPDPVPPELIARVLEAGTQAPSGMNAQPWTFLVLRAPAGKAWFGERYRHWLTQRFAGMMPAPADHTATARTLRAAAALAERMHEVPVILVVCGRRDWPFAVPEERRVGKAPPSYGAVYPCIQNLLLACRALGLGACLTTMHQMFEDEMCRHFGIPDDVGIVAVIPVGFPRGRFGPVSRRPVGEVTHYDHWGRTAAEAGMTARSAAADIGSGRDA